MAHIVAIGGGEIGCGETRAIDKHFIGMTGKRRPNILFLPTASRDEQEYIEKFTGYYQSLGAFVTSLEVFGPNRASEDEIDHKIGEADGAYASAGNLYDLLNGWRDSGLDEKLIQRIKDGLPAGGISAGANCWYEFASSSSRPDGEPEDGSMRRISGLGVIRNTIVSPHFSSARINRFPALVKELYSLPRTVRGVAIDDMAAHVIETDEAGQTVTEYAISNRDGQNARTYTVTEGDKIQIDRIKIAA